MKYSYVLQAAGSRPTLTESTSSSPLFNDLFLSYIYLDPANDSVPYPCALDISSLVTLEDVMEEHNLGPNGGVLYCKQYLEANFDWLEEGLKELTSSSTAPVKSSEREPREPEEDCGEVDETRFRVSLLSLMRCLRLLDG